MIVNVGGNKESLLLFLEQFYWKKFLAFTSPLKVHFMCFNSYIKIIPWKFRLFNLKNSWVS